MNRIVQLKQGVRVEVESTDDYQPLSGGGVETAAGPGLDQMVPLLSQVAERCREIAGVVDVESIDLELNLGFEAGGNIFITKGKVSANLVVRMTLQNGGREPSGECPR